MRDKKSERERAKDKEKYEYSSLYFDTLCCEDSLFKGFQEELPSAEFKIPCSTSLFDKWVCKVVRVLFCGIATRQFHMRVRVVRVTTRTRQ